MRSGRNHRPGEAADLFPEPLAIMVSTTGSPIEQSHSARPSPDSTSPPESLAFRFPGISPSIQRRTSASASIEPALAPVH